MNTIEIVLLAASYSLSLLAAWFRYRNGTWDGPADGCAALMGLSGCAGFALMHWWPVAAVYAVSALSGWDWWRKRRNKGRLKAWASARAEQVKAAMVRTMRETAKPRRVLRPVPGGAR